VSKISTLIKKERAPVNQSSVEDCDPVNLAILRKIKSIKIFPSAIGDEKEIHEGGR
jgi:hypothetical protein